jgi:hypothetical protein
MQNGAFFDALFKDFWSNIDRKRLLTDEHSMFGDASAFDWLIDTVKPTSIIEIGSWKGHSANYMADGCKRNKLQTKIVCVDTFLGGPEHWLLPGMIEKLYRVNGMPTIIDRFLGNVIARGNEGIIFPLTLDSSSAAQVMQHLGLKADLIFVDAGHEYNAVCSDIMRYQPMLAEGGVMWGDDYQDKQVADAVHDCATKLGVPVVVFPKTRKWIYLNNTLLAHGLPAGTDLRSSFEGWVHP